MNRIKKLPRWLFICLTIVSCFIFYQLIEKPFEQKYLFYDHQMESEEIITFQLTLLGAEDIRVFINRKTIVLGPEYASFYANPLEKKLISKLLQEDVVEYSNRTK